MRERCFGETERARAQDHPDPRQRWPRLSRPASPVADRGCCPVMPRPSPVREPIALRWCGTAAGDPARAGGNQAPAIGSSRCWRARSGAIRASSTGSMCDTEDRVVVRHLGQPVRAGRWPLADAAASIAAASPALPAAWVLANAPGRGRGRPERRGSQPRRRAFSVQCRARYPSGEPPRPARMDRTRQRSLVCVGDWPRRIRHSHSRRSVSGDASQARTHEARCSRWR